MTKTNAQADRPATEPLDLPPLLPRILGRRIRESEIDQLIARRIRKTPTVTDLLFKKCFGSEYVFADIVDVRLNVHTDHRVRSGNRLDYGENDVEILCRAMDHQGIVRRLGLLIENKIDAPLMEHQGQRYRIRGDARRKAGDWDDYRAVFSAPAARIRQLYPLGDFLAAGWHSVISFEQLVAALAADPEAIDDAQLLLDATECANHFNEPILEAVQFWKDYAEFGIERFPDVPVAIKTEAGSRAGGVWPSFYDGDFRKSRDPLRKRVQIVHVDNSARVVLFLKGVTPDAYRQSIEPLVEPPLSSTKPGKSWQGVMMLVPPIDPRVRLSSQAAALDEIFHAARTLRQFHDDHESTIRSLISGFGLADKRA